MNNYAPRPGSAAEAAVEYLRKKGGPARSGEIAEAIGIESKGIAASLAAAVENGVLIACDVQVPGAPPQKEYRLSAGGKPAPFTIGRAKVLAAPRRKDEAQEAAKPARKPRKTPKPAPAHPHDESRPRAVEVGVMHKPAPVMHKAAAKSLPVTEVPWKAEQPTPAFRCGLFNSGHLELILRDGSRIELPPEDTRELCGYLDRTLVKEAA